MCTWEGVILVTQFTSTIVAAAAATAAVSLAADVNFLLETEQAR